MELGSGTEELSDAHLGLEHRAAPELFWEGFYPNSLSPREQTQSAADSITLVVFPVFVILGFFHEVRRRRNPWHSGESLSCCSHSQKSVSAETRSRCLLLSVVLSPA